VFPHVQEFWDDANGNMCYYSPHSNKVVKCRCKNGHVWNEQINRLVKRTYCPFCLKNYRSLSFLHPELLDMWDYDKNTINPENICASSIKKVWWKCKNNHSWKESIKVVVKRGGGCNICRSFGFNYPELLKEFNDDFDPFSIACGSERQTKWKCNIGHVWTTSIGQRTKYNSPCPYCSHRVPSKEYNLLTQHPDIAKELNIEKSKCRPEDLLPKSSKKCVWNCKYGHEWVTMVSNRTAGHGCPVCNGLIPDENNNLQAMFPEIAKEWDYEKNTKPPAAYRPYSTYYAAWKCNFGHYFTQQIQKRTARGYNCPFCSGRKVCNDNCLKTLYPEIAKDWDYDKNKKRPEDFTAKSNSKQYWACEKRHEAYISIYGRVKANGCSQCSLSSISAKCVKWLDKLGIKEREQIIKCGKNNYIVDGKNNNVIYEYLGSFWHGNPMKFSPDKKHPKTRQTYGTMLYSTIVRLNKLKDLGYEIIYKWEGQKEQKYFKINKKKIDILNTARYIYSNNLKTDILQELKESK